MTAPASKLLFHHTRRLADSPYGVVEGQPWVRTAEERPPDSAAAGLLLLEESSHQWLADHIGYWPIHIGLGPPVRHWAGYEAQFEPGPAGEPIPWRAMFSFRAPPPGLLFHTQGLWSIHLASLGQDEADAWEAPPLSEAQRRRVFPRDSDRDRWLEEAREHPEAVCAVCAVCPPTLRKCAKSLATTARYGVSRSGAATSLASPRGRDKPPPQKGAMPSPFIFIATNRLKAGQLERERKRVAGLVEFIEASEPRLIAFNEYVSDAGDEVTVVQIHPDASSMEAHMETVRERAQQAYAETLDATVRIQVFGQPTDAILEALRQQAGSGVEISVNGEHLGGFTRSAAQP